MRIFVTCGQHGTMVGHPGCFPGSGESAQWFQDIAPGNYNC